MQQRRALRHLRSLDWEPCFPFDPAAEIGNLSCLGASGGMAVTRR